MPGVVEARRTNGQRYRMVGSVGKDGNFQFPPRPDHSDVTGKASSTEKTVANDEETGSIKFEMPVAASAVLEAMAAD